MKLNLQNDLLNKNPSKNIPTDQCGVLLLKRLSSIELDINFVPKDIKLTWIQLNLRIQFEKFESIKKI